MARRRGSIKKRGDAYLLTLFVGTRADGRREYRYETVKGTLRQAQRQLTKMLRELDQGILPAATHETLDSFLDRWLESKKASLSPRTERDYRYLLATHVRPRIGNERLAALRPAHIQGVYDQMTAKGLSGRTVHVAHNVVRQALSQAVGWRDLAVNPADTVVLPRWERSEMLALSAEQVRAFLAKAEGDPLAVYFHLAFASGMRPAELLALRWQDVDFTRRQVHVRHALERVKGGDWRLKEPKAHSRRAIPLPGSVVTRLQEHKREQARAALRRKPGSAYVDHGLVFAGRFGEPFDARNVASRHLKPILEAAGLPKRFRLYDTRHTCATLLAAAGENPRVIAERLGHRSVEITLNVYTHVSPGMQEQATARLGGALYD